MLTPQEIQEAIETEMTRMEALVDELRQAGYDTATAEVNFKIEFARERLKARSQGVVNGVKVNVDTADDVATVETEQERHQHLIATNNLLTLREALRACQNTIDALRTLATSARNIP